MPHRKKSKKSTSHIDARDSSADQSKHHRSRTNHHSYITDNGYERDNIKNLNSAFLTALLNNDTAKAFHIIFSAYNDGHANRVEIVLRSNLEFLNSQDGRGYNIFHFACGHGQIEIAEKLLEIEPEFLYSIDKLDKNGFHFACGHGQIKMAVKLLEIEPEFLNSVDKLRRNAFHFTCENDQLAMLIKLLELNPDYLHSKTIHGETGISIAKNCRAYYTAQWLDNIYKNGNCVESKTPSSIDSRNSSSSSMTNNSIESTASNIDTINVRVDRLKNALIVICDKISFMPRGGHYNYLKNFTIFRLSDQILLEEKLLIGICKTVFGGDLTFDSNSNFASRIAHCEKATKSMIEKIGLNQSSKELAEFAARVRG